MFNRTGYSIRDDYQCNPYGVPYFNSLLQGAKQFNAHYYAYINSDILIDPEVFSVLSFMQREMMKGSVPIAHEMAGRGGWYVLPKTPYRRLRRHISHTIEGT